jgi:hypothetical protein
MIRLVLALVLILGVGACANPDRLSATAMTGNSVEAPRYDASADQACRTGVADVLSVTVFQVENLTMKEVAMAEGPTRVADLTNVAIFGSSKVAGRVPIQPGSDSGGTMTDPYVRGMM